MPVCLTVFGEGLVAARTAWVLCGAHTIFAGYGQDVLAQSSIIGPTRGPGFPWAESTGAKRWSGWVARPDGIKKD
jgi:hypothetical protein